ncbi:MAG: hypothetical protein ACKORM_00615, partial [Solirubrobacterales bacterium]
MIGSVETPRPASSTRFASLGSTVQYLTGVPAALRALPREIAQSGVPLTSIEGSLSPSMPRRFATNGLR